MQGIILSIAVLLTVWGFLWRLADRKAQRPIYLFIGALVCLFIGGVLI